MEKTIGVLGGGQLGRMLTEAANRLNIRVLTLDAAGAPAKQISASDGHVTGSFKDRNAIRQLASKCDVLTVEIEHVDTAVLKELSIEDKSDSFRKTNQAFNVEVHPAWSTIRTIQDKYDQKEHLEKHGISTTPSLALRHNAPIDLEQAGMQLGYPFVLKSRTEAYDGRGNFPIREASDIPNALGALYDRPLYAEKWADFVKELAVMVVKTESDSSADYIPYTRAFPVVETIHEDSICKLVYAPARNVPASVRHRAQGMARKAVSTFAGRGVFGVEMFLMKNGSLLVNEIAPRPHNSGHYTVEACNISQFDAHLRAILGLPISDEDVQLSYGANNAIMLNILGGPNPRSHLQCVQEALRVTGARIHLYGKDAGRPGRKMGHLTVIASSMKVAEARIEPLIEIVNNIRHGKEENIGARKAYKMPNEVIKAPLVAVTMGSESDRHVLAPGIKLLSELDVPYSVTITSAHRTPNKMVSFAQEAASNGIKVIIAAAGGAAHLPGMIAANTRLPVIGVPVKGSVLDGLDSLLSIVQMPRGCPVASVAINNSVNAAQLAVRIVANEDPQIQQKLDFFLANQTRLVEEQAQRMENLGFDEY